MDLRTNYLGLELRSPLVPSAGPITGNPAMWQRLQDAGAGAIVLPSLFEEEIEYEAFAVGFAEEHGVDAYGDVKFWEAVYGPVSSECQKYYLRGRIPIESFAIVEMQSRAEKS